MVLLLRCLTGSRLYGTNHTGSDWDYIEVYDHVKSSHTLKDDQDVQRWSLSMFMKLMHKCSHNALDIAWAPVEIPDVDLLTDMRLSFRVNPWVAWPTFHKTIESCVNRGDRKGRLHAKRLEFNMNSISALGKFDPTEFARVTDWRSIE